MCKNSRNLALGLNSPPVLYALGIKLVPLDSECAATPGGEAPDCLGNLDLSNPRALWQEVWFDLLANGEPEWVTGLYLPSQYNHSSCSSGGHCVEVLKINPDTGQPTGAAYNFTHRFRAIREEQSANRLCIVEKCTAGLMKGTQPIIVSYLIFASWQQTLTSYRAKETVLPPTQCAQCGETVLVATQLRSPPTGE
eukprot:gene13027-44271_t